MTNTHFIVCTTVVPEGVSKKNDARVALALGMIRKVAGHMRVLAFPAGFLKARSEGEVREVCMPIFAAAKKAKLAVLLGVDASRKKRAALPYFVAGFAPGGQPVVWRQRSTTSLDAGDVDEAAVAEPRQLEVEGKVIVPVACGEIFNPRIRSRIAQQQPHVVVLSAHAAAGARHWAAQRSLARLGVRSVRAVHAAGAARDVMTGPHDVTPMAHFQHEGVTASLFRVP